MCTGAGICEESADGVDARAPSTLHDFAELAGRQWLMPCTAAPDPSLCDCVDSTLDVPVGGDVDVVYAVTVRIRGVMERGSYAGGTANGAWYAGGAPDNDYLTVAELRVSAPAGHYYVNQVATGGGLHAFDYQATVPIAGGAEVSLFMSALDGREVADATSGAIAGVTTVPSPYLGQFAQLDVVDVAVAP